VRATKKAAASRTTIAVVLAVLRTGPRCDAMTTAA
jgi:hypothetical protein